MQRKVFSNQFFSVPDAAVLILVATAIYSVFAIGSHWSAEFRPVTEIDLSPWALPYYTLLSGIRGMVAYVLSLVFSIVVGYSAAKSKPAEKIIIPLLDIFQSIPVLGFLPGLILGLVALFPRSNVGLELAAIIMIFTGQVWNLTFSFYSSLKGIPAEYHEAATVIGLNWRDKLKRVELPYSAMNLAWNSLLSMAGGWFFLIPCEAITLGDKEFRLPGIGAYMDCAIKQENYQAMGLAVVAMIALIVGIDFVCWRPALAWAQRFRLEQTPGASHQTEPLMQVWIRESEIIRSLRLLYYRWKQDHEPKIAREGSRLQTFFQWMTPAFVWTKKLRIAGSFKWLGIVALGFSVVLMSYGAVQLVRVLLRIDRSTWGLLLSGTAYTGARVLCSLVLSSIWAIPVGIWIGTSTRRIKLAQPIIQVMASFPAPMLYPLVLSVLFWLGMSFNWAAMVLIFMGVQWYVLFNVLAGALRIPKELGDALSLMQTSRLDRWRVLYLPSVFPALVTGWVTAAGGAWNASVVAEYLFYRGKTLQADGLGAILSVSVANGNVAVFAASLTLMVVVVILLNRTVWSRVYGLAQTRFRLEGVS